LEKLSSASPLLISVWGNDFTLHAPSTPLMGRYTWRTLTQAAALHADCARDIRLGRAWGFDVEKPTIVLPGGGGVQMDLFYPADERIGSKDPLTVINPRGFRAYVRNDTFFRAIPLVLARNPGVRFLCPAMLDVPQARRWVNALGDASSDSKEMADCIELLPRQSRPQMASLFRQAQVVVSPSTHDGTPNTLLEALACGCFPVVGDLESLREWITPGINGLLVDPSDPGALAEAILEGLSNIELRTRASVQNLHMIATRAEYVHVMEAARAFYAQVLTTNKAPK